jgi:hypothetical protein
VFYIFIDGHIRKMQDILPYKRLGPWCSASSWEDACIQSAEQLGRGWALGGKSARDGEPAIATTNRWRQRGSVDERTTSKLARLRR